MNRRCGVKLCLLLALGSWPLAAASLKDARKARQGEAKRLALIAQKQEKAGDYVAARTSYLQSAGVSWNKDAEKGLERISQALDKQVKELLGEATQTYAAQNFARTAEMLERARTLEPGNPAVVFDLAATKYSLGERAEAVDLLEGCTLALREGKLRTQFNGLETQWITGAGPGAYSGDLKQRLRQLNKLIVAGEEGEAIGEDDGESAQNFATAGPEVCANLHALQAALPDSPALMFDLAKCAEQEGRYDEAIRLLGEYRRLAPQALDADDVQQQVELFGRLLALEDPSGMAVRNLYASAARHIEERRWDRALADYRKAADVAPAFCETRRRIAALVDAQGQLDPARSSWEQVKAVADDESREEASQAIADLEERKKEYDERVTASRRRLFDLFQRSLIYGEFLSRPYAIDQLSLASMDIEWAGSLFPLGAEVNSLRALVAAQRNDYRSMRASFDALASFERPVVIYAAVHRGANDKQKRKPYRMARLELERDTLRFAELATCNPKKRTVTLPQTAAGPDYLGGLGRADGLRAGPFQGFTVSSDGIKKVETKDEFIRVELTDRRIKERHLWVEPLQLTALVPPSGPGARSFANRYTELFQRYVGLDNARLGKESLTFGEKLKIAYEVMDLGMNVYSSIGNPMGLYSVALSARKLNRTLATDRQRVQRIATARLQAIEGLPWKVIPVDAVQLTFRTDLK